MEKLISRGFMEIIEKELSKIQTEYLIVLKDGLTLIDSDWISVVDNINKFWYKNRKIIETSLSRWFLPNETYIFTAACVLDYNDREHLPFLLYGKQHIFDDPLCRYAQSVLNNKGTNFANKLNEKIKELIEDNILILENLKDTIYILPVSFLFNNSNSNILKNCDKIFLSMFNKKLTLKDYFRDIKTSKDLEEILKPDIVDKIPFDTNDNLKLPLAERIQIHRAKNDYLPQEATDAEIFFLVVYGHLSQTINLIFVCVNYNFIPYLRYGVAFKFFTLLIGNFLNIDNTELMLNKASLSYFTKQLFNKDYVKNINIDDYKTKCMIFEKSLLKKVFNGNTLKDGLTLKKLESIIKKSLTEIVYT